MLGIAYHYSDHLQFGSNLSLDSKDYSVEVVGDDPGESFDAKGSLDTMSLMFNVAYNVLTGPLTPYVSGGIGYAWVDTNIATEPPSVGCWWHPWYGYVCTRWQDTKSVDGFAYEVGAGVRWDISDAFSLDGGYTMRWIALDGAEGTPSFDGFLVNVGWKIGPAVAKQRQLPISFCLRVDFSSKKVNWYYRYDIFGISTSF